MMRKRLVIGDPHGLFNPILDVYNEVQPDDVIVLGDYFDSFDLAPIVQKLAFEDLLALRNTHFDEHPNSMFKLLLGNHDYHYICHFEMYSGWNAETSNYAQALVTNELGNGMDIIYVDYANKTIYSHAGVSQAWMKKNHVKSLEEINGLSLEKFRFVGADVFGGDPKNGPLWVRPEGLMKSPYIDEDGNTWTQVVGHTHHKHPDVRNLSDSAELINIDCMPYYCLVETIDDGKIIDREIKEVPNFPF